MKPLWTELRDLFAFQMTSSNNLSRQQTAYNFAFLHNSDFLCAPLFILNNRAGYRQKVSCFLGNSFVMVQYKTFDLKHYIVFVKIGPPTGQITF